jgi:hypothetical protein
MGTKSRYNSRVIPVLLLCCILCGPGRSERFDSSAGIRINNALGGAWLGGMAAGCYYLFKYRGSISMGPLAWPTGLMLGSMALGAVITTGPADLLKVPQDLRNAVRWALGKNLPERAGTGQFTAAGAAGWVVDDSALAAIEVPPGGGARPAPCPF